MASEEAASESGEEAMAADQERRLGASGKRSSWPVAALGDGIHDNGRVRR